MKPPKSARNSSLPKADRRPISVRRWWGNGDVEATVKLTRPQWRRICAGEKLQASTWSWYEGKRQRVGFRFNHPERGDLYIGGNDCADHFLGIISEAQITGADFPPRLPDATEFNVREGGTLEMIGIHPPKTRAEAYDLSPKRINDVDDLLEAADECPPLGWHLDHAHDASKKPGQAGEETDLAEWLSCLPQQEVQRVIMGVHAWLREKPNWAQEDDHIPESLNSQGAALEFFRDMEGEDLEALDIVIVEGAHPGSTYFAAELRKDIIAANFIAWKRGLPVWFSQNERR